jgi:NADPH:quinone reductase and related Zn-dependent oxidoreductases
MIAIEITRPGGPEVLQAVERPTPEPGPGEILIRVAAAGVNRPDVAQRLGTYPPPPGASDLPGLEVAGTVAKLGEGVDGFAWGTRSAPWSTAGGMPNTAPYRPPSACPCRRA